MREEKAVGMMLENINKINTLGCFHICAWMRGGQVASPPVVLAAALTYLLRLPH